MRSTALSLFLSLVLATGCSGGSGGSPPPEPAVVVTPVAASIPEGASLDAALDAEARAAAAALDLDPEEERALRKVVAEELATLVKDLHAEDDSPEHGLDGEAREALIAARTKALHARALESLPASKRDRYRALVGD